MSDNPITDDELRAMKDRQSRGLFNTDGNRLIAEVERLNRELGEATRQWGFANVEADLAKAEVDRLRASLAEDE